jgi:hypothetical protein
VRQAPLAGEAMIILRTVIPFVTAIIGSLLGARYLTPHFVWTGRWRTLGLGLKRNWL